MDIADLKKEISDLKAKLSKIEKELPSKNNLFGKTQKELGSISTETVLATSGNIKVRYGGKQVVIFKDGKLVTESNILVHKANKIGEEDGLWIVPDENGTDVIYIVSNKEIYPISGSIEYISFLSELNLTSDLKQLAQQNIGLIYPNIQAFNNSKINNGIIFITSDQKFYIVLNGFLKEYKQEADLSNIHNLSLDYILLGNTIITPTSINTDNFSIGNLKLYNEVLNIPKILCSEIEGNHFSITLEDNLSTLTVDNLVVSNLSLSLFPKFTNYNIITKVELNETSLNLKFLYLQKFDLGDILLVLMLYLEYQAFKYILYDLDGNLTYIEDFWSQEGVLGKITEIELLDNKGEIIKFVQGDLVPEFETLESKTWKTSDILLEYIGNTNFNCLSEIDEVKLLIGQYTYLIKHDDKEVPLIKLKDNILILTYNINDNKIEPKYQYLTIGNVESKAGILLTKNDESFFCKYTEDSEPIPNDIDGKTLVTAEWVRNLNLAENPLLWKEIN